MRHKFDREKFEEQKEKKKMLRKAGKRFERLEDATKVGPPPWAKKGKK